jgi:hypothetical protein
MNMRVKYIGDPENDFEGPRTIHNWGHYFPKDKFIAIDPGKDGDDARRLAPGHPHFEVELGSALSFDATTPQTVSFTTTGATLTDADLGIANEALTPEAKEAQAAQEEAEKAFLREEIARYEGPVPHPQLGLTKLRIARDAAKEAYDFAQGGE